MAHGLFSLKKVVLDHGLLPYIIGFSDTMIEWSKAPQPFQRVDDDFTAPELRVKVKSKNPNVTLD
jgi:hypothetical protein